MSDITPLSKTDASGQSDLLKQAASFLRQGKLVSFPTETVYGLGADASNGDAIQRLYEAKGRPSSHPVIVHLHALSQVHEWAIDIPPHFYKLAEAFWPGPMTIVLRRAERVLLEVTGGQETVALRIPNHPVALALLEEFGGGLVAPSANKFGRLSPTTAQHVRDEFASEVALVLDGGPCQVGIESTIIDLSSNLLRILRPGMLSAAAIAEVIGPVDSSHLLGRVPDKLDGAVDSEQSLSPRVPGALASHYAPLTPLQLVPGDSLLAFLEDCLSSGKQVSVLSFRSPVAGLYQDNWVTLPLEAHEFARRIYGCLRELDQKNCQLIVVETPPAEELEWAGVIDRLTKASFSQ